MSSETLDITPDPKVLVALTHTPLKPLDALCELIDNSIDSFLAARREGIPEAHPLIQVTVPGVAQVRRGNGVVRVSDNGSGLDRKGLENTLSAGFSRKSRYETLGLFGMGFNIATGKLGVRTTVTTAREGASKALRVVLDLKSITEHRNFSVPLVEIDKPPQLDHGTIVEVSGWWPEGSPNSSFALQLSRITKPKLRDQLGRRYATLLRRSHEGRTRILLNDEEITAFQHCVWSAERFVERRGRGIIPAMIEFDQVIISRRRCKMDGSLLRGTNDRCLECNGSSFKTLDERISGWIGIQRFDDLNRYGIDLIRNGRAIRVSEKDAFFNYTDDLGEVSKEYPL